MQEKTSNQGFSLIGVLIVALVVAVVGFGGWYVWRHGDTAKQSSSTATTVPQKKSESSDPSDDGKYLVIKEWGVRFLLPEDLRGDIEYGIRKNVLLNDKAPDGTPPAYGDVAYFASKKLEAIPANPNNCGLKPGAHDDLNQRNDPTSYDGGPGVSIERSQARQQPSNDLDYQAGSYWYRISKGSAAVCYQGSDGSQEGTFINIVMNALRLIQVVPQ